MAVVFTVIICPVCARAGDIAARVNGEVIAEKMLMDNMPPDQFSDSEQNLRTVKLERLIEEIELKQYLGDIYVGIPEKEIDDAVADMVRHPPSAGCMCCRYPDLKSFMDVNAMTMDELRMRIRNEMGLKKVLSGLWDKASSGKKKSGSVNSRASDKNI